MYEIQAKSDFQTGATLIVRIPEEELDHKAFYTILNDKPSFILPFHHRRIDGQIEFTYQIGDRSKFVYISGNRSPMEYAELWSGILTPLLDCGDWFMTPYSFVLNQEYLYCDKTGRAISFVYIPAVKACSDYDLLKSMVTEIAKQNHVTDVNLENKVVWAIQDFNPTEFLKMVKTGLESIANNKSIPNPMQQYNQPTAPPTAPKQLSPNRVNEQGTFEARPQTLNSRAVASQAPIQPISKQEDQNEISIKLKGSDKKSKQEKQKNNKAEKKKKETKEKSGLWGIKKKPQQEIIQGSAIIQNKSEVKHEIPNKQPIAPMYFEQEDFEDEVTQLDIEKSEGARLRYVGNGEHPKQVNIDIGKSGIFTIGRFDASVGSQQSNFEFDKKTRAVSRRHAAIEWSEKGYSIVDLSSAAGTYLNGQKLPPNAPFKLENGCRISFGNSGADYIWEE